MYIYKCSMGVTGWGNGGSDVCVCVGGGLGQNRLFILYTAIFCRIFRCHSGRDNCRAISHIYNASKGDSSRSPKNSLPLSLSICT